MLLSWFQKLLHNRMTTAARRGRRVEPRRPVRLNLEQLEQRAVPSASPAQIDGLQDNIKHIVVIYQENWSFDGLYGNFPGANGISEASQTSLTQVDRVKNPQGQFPALSSESFNNPAFTSDPAVLQNPPPALTSSNKIDPRWVDANGNTKIDTLHPYDLADPKLGLKPTDTTGDLVHRFWQEQSQIDGGKQDKYITWSDNPGLVMSHFDASNLPEGKLAQQYTMDDAFFHSAYGGSFLNHQFLVSGAPPVFPNAAVVTPSSLPTLDANGNLALDATGKIIHDGKITPINGTFDKNYAVNTIFSANLVPTFKKITDADLLPSQNDSDPTKANYIKTIGDLLSENNVSWKWYSGGWDAALDSSPSNPSHAGVNGTTVDPNFQWHHQPLAYFDHFAPWNKDGTRNTVSANHLQDEKNLFADLNNNALPSVSFIKQVGADNEHPGYASLAQGQQATADIVHAIQNSSAWDSTAIVITYDENGGRWDHVAPPTTDINGTAWGDGTRVPAIVISPFAKTHFVDHQQHDTSSILKTIEEDFTPGMSLGNAGNLDAKASDLLNDFTFPEAKDNKKEEKADKQELHQLEDQAADLKIEILADSAKVDQAQQDLKADNAEAARLEATLEVLKKDIAEDNGQPSEIKADKREADRLEAKLDNVKKDIAKDKSALDKAENELKTDAKESDSLEAQLKELKADVAEDAA